MPLEVLEGSVFQLFPHPTIRKERRGQPRHGSGVFPARAGLASPTMGIRAPWGGLCRAASPNWGGEGSRDAGGSPGHLPPPSEVTWVSQSQTADPPNQPWCCFLLKFAGVAWPSGGQGSGTLRREVTVDSTPHILVQPRPPSPALSGHRYPGGEAWQSSQGKGLALRELGQYLLTD